MHKFTSQLHCLKFLTVFLPGLVTVGFVKLSYFMVLVTVCSSETLVYSQKTAVCINPKTTICTHSTMKITNLITCYLNYSFCLIAL